MLARSWIQNHSSAIPTANTQTSVVTRETRQGQQCQMPGEPLTGATAPRALTVPRAWQGTNAPLQGTACEPCQGCSARRAPGSTASPQPAPQQHPWLRARASLTMRAGTDKYRIYSTLTDRTHRRKRPLCRKEPAPNLSISRTCKNNNS